jgi:class 3 adenylate cyclase/tetratricopeptide (TPR) repeat protein
MRYCVLGPLDVFDSSGQHLPVGGARQQSVLASLLLRAGQTVTLDRLVDELWEEPPATAAKTVQVYVSRLRHELPEGAIESRPGGYTLVLDGDELDLQAFERRAAEGRSALVAGDGERAAELLREALRLWRGPALAGLTSDALRREAERLEELRLRVLEDRLEADLRCGREREIVHELQALVQEHPFRERPRGQLMMALYRAGRQAEALAFYRETRNLLTEELGLEPSGELQRLERRMLAHDPELEAAAAPVTQPQVTPPPSTHPIRARRPATILFADLVNSTALAERLDPESMHNVLNRYSETCAAVLERHGGSAEKFIGDATVGVFGLTDVHEDDALRAVRAAAELREAVARLSEELERASGIELAVKIGINSGEVFVGSGSRREAFATGDSMYVAARLEQSAGAGEILLGHRTYRLVEANVRAEALEPLAVKGRTTKVRAWRLIELLADEPMPVGPLTPFVGRARELSEVREVFTRTRAERVCRLCTVAGPAGIGKSRLAQELVEELGDSTTIAVGRCLSYGEGITYHALIEIVKQLAGSDPDRHIAELLGNNEQAELVARRVRVAIGLSDETAPAEETFWAFRRLFEAVARERPLLVVFEDIHWAEPMLLDLLEYLVGFSEGAPIFLLCLTRPDLLEIRPSWLVPHRHRPVLVLEALSETDARELVYSIGSDELDQAGTVRIVRTGEGNPLFLEQLVAARAESGEQDLLPPSVQALLAARITSLEPGERTVLERAAVEGRNFMWSSVSALLPEADRPALGQHLMALVRRQLIQPDRPSSAGEDAFRFSHVLIQEAAYGGLPKQMCAELHERLARRLATNPAEEDEIVGYHLEQAYRCRAQLGLVGSHEQALAREATTRLETAARKALLRGDPAAGSNLLGRSASLLPADDPTRLALLPRLGAALFEAGRLVDADHVLTESIERSASDDLLVSRARVEQQLVRLQAEAEGAVDEAQHVADAALRVFKRHDDDLCQCRAWCLKASIAWIIGQVAGADEAWRRAADHARRAGEERELFEILDWRASAALVGPTPVEEAITRCIEIREQVQSSPVAVAETLHPLAGLHAMRGEFDLARALIREGSAILDELGRIYSAGISHHEAFVEMLAGEPAIAEERLRRGYDRLEEMGEKALLATTAAVLAQAVYAQGRLDEAQRFYEVSREAAVGEDLSAQVVSRGVRAKILARQGRADEAEALAREAVELVAQTDFLTYHGDALLDLAEVMRLRGQPEQEAAAMQTALELYELKGNIISAERVRSRLEQVSSG